MIFTSTKLKLSSLLEASKVVMPKKDIRYFLNGAALYFYNDKLCHIVSNNGNQMLKFTIQGDVSLQRCEIKIVDCIHLDTLIAKFGDMFASEFTPDLLDYDWLIDGRYPDAHRVIPKRQRSQAANEIGLNVKMLSCIKTTTDKLKKGYKVTKGESNMLYNWKLGLGENTEAILAYKTFVVNGCDGVSVEYIQMPVRL